MVPHSYRVSNCGTVDVILDKFVFNTPPGLKHSANLVNFGGPENFDGNIYQVVNSAIPVDDYRTFTIDYIYESGPNCTKCGNIVISSITGKTSTIYTTINVEAPCAFDAVVASCTLTPNQATWNLNVTA